MPRIFTCEVCDKHFTHKGKLNRHFKKHVDLKRYHCNQCGLSFSRQDGLTQHMFNQHQMGGKRIVPRCTGAPVHRHSGAPVHRHSLLNC